MATTYSELVANDQNMIIQRQWPRQRDEFADYLTRKASAIEHLVAHHLSLHEVQACKIGPRAD
jgi:uncharacterized protein (DUF2236 family)